ncbi:hypothetical protein A2335_01375 [Candidatus Peregrinibacteria bacterium RIFOXYB2_FULL_32_7]|nr:MAG: hypothetical protein A2335_01375 [Candidatus Peregrinibacteria bacterium RIFOXYB2_FULL_32_7]
MKKLFITIIVVSLLLASNISIASAVVVPGVENNVKCYLFLNKYGDQIEQAIENLTGKDLSEGASTIWCTRE